MSDDQDLSAGGAFGILVTLLLLLGGAFAYAIPIVSIVVFAIAGLFALLAGTTGFSDMVIWAFVAFTLAGMSFFGNREKQRASGNTVTLGPHAMNRASGERPIVRSNIETSPPTKAPAASESRAGTRSMAGMPDTGSMFGGETNSSQRSQVFKVIGIGCGGLVAIFLVLAIIGALIGGGESNTESRPTVGVGQPVTVGEVVWTVTNAKRANQLQQTGFGEFGDTKQGNFVIVDFDFKNNSNEALTLDSSSLTLVDSSGRESETDTDTFGYVPEGKDVFLEQVNPGLSRQGQVIFSVASDASGFKLQLGDTDPFSGESGSVNLGF